MAYIDADLYKVAELGGGKTMWAYHTVDTAATVDSAAYFTGQAVTKLKVGDLIYRTTYTTTNYTGAYAASGWHAVSANDGTTVDINDALAITATDTD